MAKSQASSAVCPCRVSEDQKLSYSDCCEPLIRGKQKADTAESLMRARYTAFAKHEIDFILTSHHSKTRGEVNREEIEDWAKNSEWLGLKIVQVEAGKASDNQGVIIFHAEYNAPDSNPAAKGAIKHHDHWERSLFEKEGGEWKFLDAQGIQQGPIRRSEPKIGRNDACPCGSGKKYKKCHA